MRNSCWFIKRKKWRKNYEVNIEIDWGNLLTPKKKTTKGIGYRYLHIFNFCIPRIRSSLKRNGKWGMKTIDIEFETMRLIYLQQK